MIKMFFSASEVLKDKIITDKLKIKIQVIIFQMMWKQMI